MKTKFYLMLFLSLLVFELKSQDIRNCNNAPCDSCSFIIGVISFTTYPNIYCVLKEDFYVSTEFEPEDERIVIVFREKDKVSSAFYSLYKTESLNEEEIKMLSQKLEKIQVKAINRYDSMPEEWKLPSNPIRKIRHSNGFAFPVKLFPKEK